MAYTMRDFRVGDVVRFRQWDDMVSEFGYKWRDCINCEAEFIDSMKYLCGTTATIKSMEERRLSLCKFEAERENNWHYSYDMIEPVLSNGDFVEQDFIDLITTV